MFHLHFVTLHEAVSDFFSLRTDLGAALSGVITSSMMLNIIHIPYQPSYQPSMD